MKIVLILSLILSSIVIFLPQHIIPIMHLPILLITTIIVFRQTYNRQYAHTMGWGISFGLITSFLYVGMTIFREISWEDTKPIYIRASFGDFYAYNRGECYWSCEATIYKRVPFTFFTYRYQTIDWIVDTNTIIITQDTVWLNDLGREGRGDFLINQQ